MRDLISGLRNMNVGAQVYAAVIRVMHVRICINFYTNIVTFREKKNH